MTYQYLMLSRNTVGDLSESVNHALLNGWELWGNPFWGHSYCQALVKWEETETDLRKKAEKVAKENGWRTPLDDLNDLEKVDLTNQPAAGFDVGAPETSATHVADMPDAGLRPARAMVQSSQPLMRTVPVSLNLNGSNELGWWDPNTEHFSFGCRNE
jgi:hypothetical protein